MRVAQLHLVLVQKVLGHRTLHGLAVVQLQGEGLHLSGASRDVAHPVLPPHGAAVGDFDFEALDLLGEFDPL